MELAAQIISIVAMAFNILSYQQKRAKGVIAMQFFGGSLFAVSFLMQGAYIGGILNIIGAVRAVLFYYKEKFKTDRIPWLVVFIGSYLAAYAATFLVFHKEPTAVNFLIECLPVIGMVATNLAFRYKEAAIIRRFGLVSSCCWLVYNVVALNIGAIACEVLSIGSIFIGMLRLDRKK